MSRSNGCSASSVIRAASRRVRGSVPSAATAAPALRSMAAAAAASGCTAPVTVRDCACTDKSYPRFWTDLSALKTVPAAENTDLE